MEKHSYLAEEKIVVCVERDGKPVLRAENSKYSDIHPFHLDVQGVAVKVIKDVY